MDTYNNNSNTETNFGVLDPKRIIGMIVCVTCLLLCSLLNSFAKEPTEVLQELKKFGLGENHPKVKALRLLISEGISKDDPRMVEFESISSRLKNLSKVDDSNRDKHVAELYGHKIHVQSMYIAPPRQATRQAEDRMMEELFKVLSNPETRKSIAAMHPTEDGVLVVASSECLLELHLAINRMNRTYVVQGPMPVSDGYSQFVVEHWKVPNGGVDKISEIPTAGSGSAPRQPPEGPPPAKPGSAPK